MTQYSSLSTALDACPFDTLGWHEMPEERWLVRAWIPGALSIALHRKSDGKLIGKMTQIIKQGLYELNWPKRSKRCTYFLRVERLDTEFDIIDAYQFGYRTFTDFPHDGNKIYLNQGAHVCSTVGPDDVEVKGVRFAVYAPNARAVSVLGAFNDWDGRRSLMASGNDGVWRLFIPELQAGDLYKFEIKLPDGNLLPLKSDPVGFYHEQYPSFASVVVDHSIYQWHDQKWLDRKIGEWRKQPMTIYELHVGSWRHKDEAPLHWDELGDQLIPYMEYMNFTHIELMPVSEYPFDGSWGYQPVGLFAPSSRFGTVDQFKKFIDRCHNAGIGVIVDWVPAHFPSDPHGLARFDGSCLYEYEDPRKGWHPDWNSHIYDYGKSTVCDFLVSSAMAWAEYFHIDGIRVDAVASMLYLDYSREDGEWIPNVDGGNENYESIGLIKRFNETLYGNFPNIVTIAEESTSFSGVTTPVFMGGLGFGFKWNMGWMHDSLEYIQHDPVHRKYHHDEMTFSMVYSFSENFVLPLSHDEVVHGKGSILSRMPGDEWQKFANLRAYYGFMFTHPGKKLNFMSNEYAQFDEWNHRHSLDWHLGELAPNKGCQLMIRDLNRIYREESALHQLDCEPAGFGWINYQDSEFSLISFARFDEHHNNTIIVITNFTPTPHEHHTVGVPYEGEYELIFNSDASIYWGSDFVTGEQFHTQNYSADNQPYCLNVRIPPLSTIMLKKKTAGSTK